MKMMMVKKGRKSDISILSEELLVEILSRLGCVKSATQCKPVCKLWCSLVKNDSYWLRRWERMNHKMQSVTLITEYDKQVIELATNDYRGQSQVMATVCVNLNFLPRFNGKTPAHVLGSHKDLLLCCLSMANLADHSCYYICNPLTKQWTALPPPPPPLGRGQLTELELTYISLWTKVEFIVDERADGGLKFTVVRIIPYNLLPPWVFHDKKVQVSVFSSDGGWREMDDSGAWREMFEGRILCQKIVSYKGRLVWLMRKAYPAEVTLYSWDLHSNCTRLPLITNRDYKFIDMSAIGVCEGRLRMARVLDGYKKLIVWQLDDGKRQEWDLVLELHLHSFGKSPKDGVRIYTRDMAFHPHDGDILYICVTKTYAGKPETLQSSRIDMYNLKSRRRELARKLPMHIVWGAKFFPLEKNCWPTPVPRLQP